MAKNAGGDFHGQGQGRHCVIVQADGHLGVAVSGIEFDYFAMAIDRVVTVLERSKVAALDRLFKRRLQTFSCSKKIERLNVFWTQPESRFRQLASLPRVGVKL